MKGREEEEEEDDEAAEKDDAKEVAEATGGTGEGDPGEFAAPGDGLDRLIGAVGGLKFVATLNSNNARLIRCFVSRTIRRRSSMQSNSRANVCSMLSRVRFSNTFRSRSLTNLARSRSAFVSLAMVAAA